MNITAIYKIQSIIKPERIYIGSAIDIMDRWRCHRKTLRKGIHCNSKLQNHFNKYGESDLQFSILLRCGISELIEKEQKFIDSDDPYFNICRIAGSQLGFKFSEESKDKMSRSHIGQSSCNKGKKGLQTAWNKGLKGYRAGRKDPIELCNKHREDNLLNGNIPPSQKGRKRTKEQIQYWKDCFYIIKQKIA